MRLRLDYSESGVYNRHACPNSLVVKHVLGKDESQVRFLLRAPSAFAYATARLVSQKANEGVELEKRMSRCNERSE